MTITVSIEESHEAVGFGSRNLDLDFAKSGVELFGINLSVAIEGVEVSESSSETSNGLGTTGLELRSNSLENYNENYG